MVIVGRWQGVRGDRNCAIVRGFVAWALGLGILGSGGSTTPKAESTQDRAGPGPAIVRLAHGPIMATTAVLNQA
jgi:hypothetical protein